MSVTSHLIVYLLATFSLSTAGKMYTLNFVAFVPLPDKVYDPLFDQGLSLVPAVRLAADQINNRSDILPLHDINILVRDSGCDKASKTTVNVVSVLRDLLVTRNGPVAVIGPACSEDSVLVVHTFRKIFSLPVLYSGTTPVLSMASESTLNGYGMVSSTETLVDVLLGIAEEERWDWRNVAVLYDDSRGHYQQTYNVFIKRVGSQQNALRFGYTRRIKSSQIPLKTIIESNIRIIIMFSGKRPALETVCLAGQPSGSLRLFPIRQFIFVELRIEDFLEAEDFSFTELGEGKRYHCDRETIMRGLNGSVLLHQSLDLVADEAVTVSRVTAGEVKSEYKKRLAEYGREMNLNLSESRYAYPYYDATWAAALGFHHTFLRPNGSFAVLHNEIAHNTSFQGVSGWIDFHRRRHVTNNILIRQVNMSVSVKKGVWNGSTLMYDPDTFITDTFKTDTIILHHLLVALGVVLASALLISTVALQIMTVVYRKYSSVKASSVQLNHFIYLGFYLLILAIVTSTLRQTLPQANGDVLCNFEIFSNILAFCFIAATVLVKSWRTYRIFNHVFKTARAHRYSLHSITLTTLLLFLTLLQVLLCLPVLVASPFREVISYDYDTFQWPPVRRLHSLCVTQSVGYISLPLLFQLCLIMAALFLATLNRNVKRKHFRTTKNIVILVYLLTVLWATGGPLLAVLYHSSVSANVTYLLYLSLLVSTVVLCQALLIVPSLLPIFFGKGESKFSLLIQSIRYSVRL